MAKRVPPKKAAHQRTRRVTLSPRESTEITGIGLSNTYELLRSGRMPAIRVGNRFYIPRVALEKWLESAGQDWHPNRNP
jgi:excisionase family DNA binding protein